MSNSSVGVISLDLVIKNKLEEQLEKIKSSVRSPAEKLGETISATVEKAMKSVGKTAGKAVSEAMESAESSVDNGVEAALERLYEREEKQRKALLEAVNSVSEKTVSSNGNYIKYNANEIMKQINEFEAAINTPISRTVEEANEKLAAFGKFEVSSGPVERLRQEIELTKTQMNLLQKKWQELSAAEPSDKVTAQLAATEQKIISSKDKLDSLQSKLAECGQSGTTAGEKSTSAFKRISDFAAKTGTRIKSVLGGAFNTIKGAGGKLISSLSSRFANLSKTAASVTKPVSRLGKSLKTTFKNVFFIAGIYAAFRALKNGFLEAANADKKFSESLNAVKANLSIAFTPILQSVMPVLNTLMSGLASVTKSIAGFISGLFGTTYKQAAEATKKLKGVADTAKKAKLSAAGIDEMNILSGDSGDSSSGSENQGIDYSNIDMTESELPDWAERLKDSIKSGDWAGVGAILAERVNSVFGAIKWDKIQSAVNSGIGKITDGINGFLDNINWETLGDTLAGGLNTITGAINSFYSKVRWDKLGSGIAKGLNQAIRKTNWKQLGKAFSAKIQAFIKTAYSFVTTFDWSGFGNAIAESVNGWFEGIDFGKAGSTLSEGIKGLLDTAINAVQNINWRQIGQKLSEFIAAIDFSGIARRFFELFGSALGAGVSFIWGALENLVKSIKEYFSKKIDECGGNVALGFLKGIADGLLSVGKWIKDNIFKPFINGFKKAFGINSPSKEMATMGGYIIDGLFNAISDGIAEIKEIFNRMLEAIKEIFSGIDKWFEEKFAAARDGIEGIFSGIGDWFSDRWGDIKSAFSSVGTWFSDTFSEAWDNIKSVFSFSNAQEFFGEVWSGIKSCFSHVTSWFSDTFSEAWQAVKDVFSKGGAIFEGIADNIASVFKETVNSLIDGINWVIAQPFNAINSALDGIRNVEIMDWEPFSWLPTIDIPEIPKLAEGGLATAPTLAMVGDNRNALTDPEVIAPLSKLQGMLGKEESEIIELLKIIIQLLKNGISAEIIGSIFGGDFKRAVLKICADDEARRGR